jgi:hypothetical protein
MYYYIVEKIGDGSKNNPFRPNYEGSFVWNPDAVCPHCNTYIIGLMEETVLLQPITDLDTACGVRSLSISDVEKWFVGGSG